MEPEKPNELNKAMYSKNPQANKSNKQNQGFLKRLEPSTDRLAGCFQEFYRKNKVPSAKAVKKAAQLVAYEIATKNVGCPYSGFF